MSHHIYHATIPLLSHQNILKLQSRLSAQISSYPESCRTPLRSNVAINKGSRHFSTKFLPYVSRPVMAVFRYAKTVLTLTKLAMFLLEITLKEWLICLYKSEILTASLVGYHVTWHTVYYDLPAQAHLVTSTKL